MGNPPPPPPSSKLCTAQSHAQGVDTQPVEGRLLAVMSSASLFSHIPTAMYVEYCGPIKSKNLSTPAFVLHLSCPASVLSCIRPLLHLSCPASALSFIHPVLNPSCPVLHLICPASVMSCISPVLHPACSADLERNGRLHRHNFPASFLPEFCCR